MKAYIRPAFIIFAIILIGLAVGRGLNGGSIDYISIGLAVATLILALIVMRQDEDGPGG